MTRQSRQPLRPRSRTAVSALVAAVLALGSACSSGHGHPQSHAKATSAKPTPKPSGPCNISTTVTCVDGTLPVWTADEVRSRLLGPKDVLPSMTHPYDPTWWGLTSKNQYMRQWATGNYIPGCQYKWIGLTGPGRVISGHNYLWSDDNPDYPHWPREGITQYAYVYSNSTMQAQDITAAWGQTCNSGHLPYRQLIGDYYSPPAKVVDQTTVDVRSGWAHKRVLEKRWPDNSTVPEEDIFDYLQNGNVLIATLTVEQYAFDPKYQQWDRTLSEADLMLGRQVAKLSAAQ